MGTSMGPERDISSEREEAELERLRLENRKLALEIGALSKPRSWFSRWVQAAPVLTIVLAFAGFAWGLIQYRQEQARNRATAEREFMKPWLDAQRDAYRRSLQAISTIANTEDPKARKDAIADFWKLYHGEMILVETKAVSDAMVGFGHCLEGAKCDRDTMNARCRVLATAMATCMAATARMTYAEFAANQFRYTPAVR